LNLPQNKVVPSSIPELIKLIVHNFERARIDAGQAVGILASQALAAQLMQATLNTFHMSGSSKNVASGLKAYREVLSLSKELIAPSCDIYFNEPITFIEVITQKRVELVDIRVTDIATNIEIKDTESVFNDMDTFNINHYKMYELFNSHLLNIGMPISDFVISNTTFLRLTLDINKMYSHKIMPNDVCKAIMKDNLQDIICIPSPILLIPKTTRKLYYNNGTNQYKNITKLVPVYYVDIYVFIGRATEKIKERIGSSGSFGTDVSISTVYFNTGTIPILHQISIKGIRDIKNIYPEK
ncbi:unnamed protein product, partial [marine sediment metagenome]